MEDALSDDIIIGYRTAGVKSSYKKVILKITLLYVPDSLIPSNGFACYGFIKFTTGKFGLSDIILGTNYYRHNTLLNVQYLLASVILARTWR